MLDDRVLLAALDEARKAGADYAEARLEDTRTDTIRARNGAVERLSTDRDAGWGIHTLAGAGWGFASTSLLTASAIRDTARLAVEIAQAGASRRKSRSDLSLMPTHQGEYSTPMERDPFEVTWQERIELATEATNRISSGGDRVKVATSMIYAERHDKLYMNTLGARLKQEITYEFFDIAGVAVDDTGYSYRRSLNDMSQAGWEFIEKQDLFAEGSRVGREAHALVVAPQAPSGPRQVVIASDFVALLVHESCGHPTELDRVLGWEAAFAGTSFLMPEMRGKFRYGSPLVNMTADSLLPGGCGTFGWDDEGTPAQRSPLVQEGIFTGYLSSRESALVLGEKSNGCGRATSWGRIPIVRMVNVSLEPGSGTASDLIAGVDDGLYVETPSSWSLDDKRMNFHFSAELCREIKGGKLGELRKGASFQGRTPAFWGSVRGIAGKNEWRAWGFPHCAKGEPLQLCPVSHGASPILVDNLLMSERR
ncbi:MAG TPA: TldD/PmbA family protein [Chloroflexia bacterium]|nr:TldD/PmbA family protein [Chloroflexia bacterium]